MHHASGLMWEMYKCIQATTMMLFCIGGRLGPYVNELHVDAAHQIPRNILSNPHLTRSGGQEGHFLTTRSVLIDQVVDALYSLSKSS